MQSPLGIIRTRDYYGGTIKNQEFSFIIQNNDVKKIDFDLSATLEPVPFLRLGMSLMNILGTKFEINDDQKQNLRALGIGATFQKKRVNIGGEIYVTENSKTIYQSGVNYIPFNHTLINIGFSSYHDKVMLGFNYRNLFYTYNHDALLGNYHILGTRLKF